MKNTAVALLSFLLLAASAAAVAEGLQTTRPTVIYDGPSSKSVPRGILAGHYPLKEITKVQGWHKVTTANGNNGWLAAADVAPARRGVILANRATIHNAANDASPPVFYAQRGVVLEVLGKQGNWLKVLHPDGETGYIIASAIWQNS